jgi:hypothetical protein
MDYSKVREDGRRGKVLTGLTLTEAETAGFLNSIAVRAVA